MNKNDQHNQIAKKLIFCFPYKTFNFKMLLQNTNVCYQQSGSFYTNLQVSITIGYPEQVLNELDTQKSLSSNGIFYKHTTNNKCISYFMKKSKPTFVKSTDILRCKELNPSFLSERLIMTLLSLAFHFKRWQASIYAGYTGVPHPLKIFNTPPSKSSF